MEKKKKQRNGAYRNVDEKKKRLKKAVGKILGEKGFGHLGVNKVSFEAGISKNLIYRYFGSYKNLIEQYSEDIDYWLNQAEPPASDILDEKEIVKSILRKQFEYLTSHPQMRQLVLWELHESNYNTTSLLKKREQFAEDFILKRMDKKFKNNVDFRAVLAVLVASVYHLAAFSSIQKSTFCGIDLREKKGKQRIVNAIELILDEVI